MPKRLRKEFKRKRMMSSKRLIKRIRMKKSQKKLTLFNE